MSANDAVDPLDPEGIMSKPADPITEWLGDAKPLPPGDYKVPREVLVEFELAKTTETLNDLSQKHISEDMLQTVAGAMGVHSAPGLLYVGTDGQVTRVDWDTIEDDREVEVLMALLRVAAGKLIAWNTPSEQALRSTSKHRGY